MVATGCRDFDPILPFDAPKYVSSNAQTVTCVPEGRSGYSVTEVRFSICDVSTEKGEQIEYGKEHQGIVLGEHQRVPDKRDICLLHPG